MTAPAATQLYPPFSATPLRVLVLVGCDVVPALLARTLHDLATSAHVRPAHLRVSGDMPATVAGPAFRVFLGLERVSAGAMLAVLAPTVLPGNMFDRRVRGDLDTDGRLVLDAQAMTMIETCAPDLILVVGLARPSAALAALARHGAWTLEPHACDPLATGAWMLGAFVRGESTTLAGLCVHDSVSDAWRMLEPGMISPPRVSFARHRAYQLQKAPAQLLRALRRLAEDAPMRWAPRPAPMPTHAGAVALLMGRLATRALSSMLQR